MQKRENGIWDIIRLNEFGKLVYYNPEEQLRGLKRIEVDPQIQLLAPEIRELRKREFKSHLERRQAALFCYAMSQLLEQKLEYAYSEKSDYDCVARWIDNDVQHFTPIQLKEVHHIRTVSQINVEISKLGKYTDSEDMVVAMWVNGYFHANLNEIVVPPLHLGGLWLYGSLSSFQDNWVLYGDLLKLPTVYEWKYPV